MFSPNRFLSQMTAKMKSIGKDAKRTMWLQSAPGMLAESRKIRLHYGQHFLKNKQRIWKMNLKTWRKKIRNSRPYLLSMKRSPESLQGWKNRTVVIHLKVTSFNINIINFILSSLVMFPWTCTNRESIFSLMCLKVKKFGNDLIFVSKKHGQFCVD